MRIGTRPIELQHCSYPTDVNSKPLLLIVSFVIGLNGGAIADKDYDEKERFERIERAYSAATHQPLRFDPNTVDADIRGDVLAELRRRAMPAGTQSQTALLHIWDKEYVEMWKVTPALFRSDSVRYSGQPRLIPYLIDKALEDDGVKSYSETVRSIGDTSIGGSTPPTGSREVILEILKNSHEVSGDVRVWASANGADGLLYRSKPSDSRKMITEWWAANKGHIENERFDLVRPGAYLSTDEKVMGPAPPVDMRPLSSRASPQSQSTQGEQAPNQNSSNAARPLATVNLGWYYAIGGAALLGALVLLRNFIRKS